MLFEPNLHELVWGGDKLTGWKGLPQREHIGESWEVSAIPSSPSVVANGYWTGKILPEVLEAMPVPMLGKQVVQRFQGGFPLLVKFIDSKGDLSIQVHPDDEMAHRMHGKFGKTEMWYVLDAEPGACLYSGFKEALTREEYQKKVTDGTITDTLARHEVHKGDVFYIPSGRVHSICKGVQLVEVQQSSDLTYRIFDYNRPGLDGKPRELHTDLALEALNFSVEEEYRTEYSTLENKANRVIDSEYFSVRVLEFNGQFHRDLVKYDSFIICVCLKGDCKLRVRSTGTEITLREGYSCLIPAAIADYDITPLGRKTRVLDAYIDNMDRSLTGKVARFLHISSH